MGTDLIAADWNKPHWGNHEANLRFLGKIGALETPLDVLEIGSGKGAMMQHLQDGDHRVVGIELDRDAIEESRREYGELPVCIARAEALPFASEEFDLVASFDVFEHIPDTDLHLREVSRVLRTGGHYILQTPNKWTNMLFEPIRFARKYGIRNTFTFLEDHCSLHSYWQIVRRFRRNGFEVQFFDIPVVNEFFRLKVKRFLGSPGVFVLKFVNPDKFPLPLRTNFYVQARKIGAPS